MVCRGKERSSDHPDRYFLRAYYASGGVLSTFHEWSRLILPLSVRRKSFYIVLHSPCEETEAWEFAQCKKLVNNWAGYKPSPFPPQSQSSHLLRFSAFHSAGKKHRSSWLIQQILIEAQHVLSGPVLGTGGPSVNKRQMIVCTASCS